MEVHDNQVWSVGKYKSTAVAELEPKMKIYSIIIMCFAIVFASGRGNLGSDVRDNCAWVQELLDHIESVQVGMPRAELEKFFTTEGGIYSRSQRTYVYRNCPLIKVDVEFAPSEQNQNSVDRITKISRPYIARPIAD